MAVQCMNNHDVLAPLPIVPPQKARLTAVPAANVGADTPPYPHTPTLPPPPITKRELYGKLGGHPYTIDVFARRAAVTGVADTWLEIEDVEREMIEFTLLDRTYAQLPPRAQTLLMRASILEEPPPLEGLQWMMGLDNERDAMPAIDAELKALLGWGMLARQERGRGEVVYPMHALVHDYARRQLAGSAEDETVLLLRAARFWELQGQQSGDLGDWLRARDYYYRAGEYEKADDIVVAATEPMMRWGLLERLIGLLNESIGTLEGTSNAKAMGNLAIVYQGMGDYKMAIQMQEQVRALFEAQGDKSNVAIALRQIGVVYQVQGEYSKAQAKYEQSLAINVELGDKLGIAYSLGNLGNLHYLQGNYQAALERYEDCLRISRELGDKSSVAIALHQLGMIHQEQGNLGEAQAKYEQSLAIAVELGDKSGIAKSLHQLGMIHQKQGNLGEAQAKYEQSLAINVELGDKSGIATSLHQLGMIHQAQGNLGEAQAKYGQSLAIKVELGDKRGIAQSLHQLGMIHQVELGDKSGIATSLHQLGMIHQEQGNLGEAQAKYEQSLAIRVELGNKSGIASSLHQLGRIHQLQGHYRVALGEYVQALMLFEQLGSPDARIARNSLAVLRDEMGEEAFAAALAELGVEAGDVPETEAVTLEQVVDMVVQNTVAVLTDAPEKREQWWGTLVQSQAQAQQSGNTGFAAFLEAVQQVVEGADQARVSVELEEPFVEAWGRLVEELGGKSTSDKEIHDET
jgi:tetratricopeptide (TPR) repeat protein